MRSRLWISALLLPFALLPAAPAAAGGGCGSFTDGAGPDVDAARNCFAPTVARVDPGDTVTWRNTDGVPHNITTTAGFGGDLPMKGTFTHRFAEAGVYPYVCTLHPNMVGAVVVGDGVPRDMDLAAVRAPAGSAATPAGTWARWMPLAGALAVTALGVAFARTRRRRID